MADAGLTTSGLPVPTNVPPHEPVYHLTTVPVPPPPPTKVRVDGEPLHTDAGDAVADVGFVDFTTIVLVLPAPADPAFVLVEVKLAVVIAAGINV